MHLRAFVMLGLAFLGSADAAPKHPFRRGFTAMGTAVDFIVWTDDDVAAEPAVDEAMKELRRIETLMTDWEHPGEPASDVVQVNRNAGRTPVAVHPETLEVIDAALEMSRRSAGAFDISYAAMRGVWKFDEEIDRKLPSANQIAALKKLINYKDIVVDHAAKTVFLKQPGMRIGLGGIAKGYAVDHCVAVLRKRGLNDFVIQAGGDLFASGSKSGMPWMVGIRDPRALRGDYFASAPVENHSFSTAGDYERSFMLDGKRYHHIIDPRTGYPATASRSVAIWAKDALTADAIDDAVFILGPEKGLELVESIEDCGAVVVDAANKVWISKRLVGKVQVLKPPTPGI